MRNLLEEFNEDHGVRPPTILGVREHIFTGRLDSHITFLGAMMLELTFKSGIFKISDPLNYCCCSVSSLAWFMSNQETSFVTLGQRVLARPLKYVSSMVSFLFQ